MTVPTPLSGATPSTSTSTPTPTPRPPWWRHLVSAAVLVALLVAAGAVADTAPTTAGWQAPIEVPGTVGETLSGRNIEATVLDARAADAVTTSNGWAGATTGVWIVVDASVSAVVDDEAALLGTAVLEIGARSYSASDRPGLSTLAGTSLSTGIPTTGPLLFEVPRDALGSVDGAAARLTLGISNDPRVDSLLVVPLDLTALDVQPQLETDDLVVGLPEAGSR